MEKINQTTDQEMQADDMLNKIYYFTILNFFNIYLSIFIYSAKKRFIISKYLTYNEKTGTDGKLAFWPLIKHIPGVRT